MPFKTFLKISRVQGKVSYFFEEGHESRGRAYKHIANKLQLTEVVTFGSKTEVPLLQSADLLAWQAAKYAKDYLYNKIRGEAPKRPPRKDFQSLMEHSHSFAYMHSKGGKKYMGIELWPLSRRSQASVSMSVNQEGPITYLQEEGSQTPIIPIQKTVRFRMGGGRMIQVEFDDLNDKRFALAFDEPRLIEALSALLEASTKYEGEVTPVFAAQTVTVQELSGSLALRIELQNGASVVFHLPADVLRRIKEVLS